MKNDGFNPGAVIKHEGRVMVYLFGDDVKKCLAVDQHGRLEVARVEGDVELIKYEHLTNFLRTRLDFLNAKYGDNDEESTM
jgi:hypothetical protein